jgi:hypothetical protein
VSAARAAVVVAPAAWLEPKLVAALAAIVDSSAVPSAPPTCWQALTSAEATPASVAATPIVELFIAVAKMNPRPAPMTSRPGRIGHA